MIRAAFFDVDGTLLSHTQQAVPQSARIALEQLAQKGIKRVVATGRHMLELAQLPIADVAFDAYITLNGQLCLDGSGNILSEAPIDGADKEEIQKLFREKKIPVMLVEKEDLYINFVNQRVKDAQDAISTPVPPVGEYGSAPIYMAVAFIGKEEEKELAARLPGCAITRWNDWAVDVISSSGGKTIGIEKYLQQSNISREQTIAFGDGENDMEMLRYAGIGVAMGNADDRVKASADHIAPSVDEDGIMEALKRLRILP